MILPRISKLFARKAVVGTEAVEKIDKARLHFENGRRDAAMSICEDLLRTSPDDYESICLLAEINASNGITQKALELYARAIELLPEKAMTYYKRANLLKNCGHAEESLKDYDRAVAANPNFAIAFCNRGVVLQQLDRLEEALESYCRAIELSPTDAFAHFNRGLVLRELNQLEEARRSFEQAVAIKTDYADCYCNLGLLQADLKEWQGALASYNRCIEIRPGFAHAYFSRGVLQQARMEWEEALSNYDRAIELEPGHAEAHNNRGVLLGELRQWSAAYASLGRAISLRPQFAEAYFNKGNLLAQVSRPQDAIANFDRAIALKPDYVDAFQNRADAYLQVKQYESAIQDYDRAIRQDSKRSYLMGMRLHAQMNICDWTDLELNLRRLSSGIEAGEPLTTPFPLLALLDRPDLQLKVARLWARDRCSVPAPTAILRKHSQKSRLRIGYFSGDFYVHPVSMIIAGVIESHDRSKFEVIGFSYGPDTRDDMRRRLEKAFDQFIDVRDKSDQEVASMARSLEIDIAVDLAGYTGNGRTKIFAWRAAPLQINFLGYPGTMGTNFMDYLVADATVLPMGQWRNYTEKVIYLPTCILPIDSTRKIAEIEFSREQHGLPTFGFVFCCFNNSYKITPDVFELWMRILKRTPNGVLWLSRNNETAVSNLRRECSLRGIAPERLVFADRVASHAEHLARQRLADLFLDTLPYNAHATATDALWAGLPLVTQCGEAFPGRVAASLVKAIGLPELITSTPQEYEELAVRLAANPPLLAEIKDKLLLNRSRTQLFDTRLLATNLEAAFEAVQERLQANQPPDYTYV